MSIIIVTAMLIVYTPLKQLIPGYTDMNTKYTATYAALKADSLENQLANEQLYFGNLKTILLGELPAGNDTGLIDAKGDYSDLDLSISKEDSLLRVKIEQEEKYNLNFSINETENGISAFFFFTPMNGIVSSGFDEGKSHFGIDVVAPKNEAVKATLDGTVVMAAWTAENGYIIQLQHKNNLVSFYKHNSVLLKKQGEFVKAGEAIAIVGESGKYTDGPHLHFELWHNGKAVDPTRYMIF